MFICTNFGMAHNVLGQKRSKTKVANIFRIFVPKFAPNFSCYVVMVFLVQFAVWLLLTIVATSTHLTLLLKCMVILLCFAVFCIFFDFCALLFCCCCCSSCYCSCCCCCFVVCIVVVLDPFCCCFGSMLLSQSPKAQVPPWKGSYFLYMLLPSCISVLTLLLVLSCLSCFWFCVILVFYSLLFELLFSLPAFFSRKGTCREQQVKRFVRRLSVCAFHSHW